MDVGFDQAERSVVAEDELTGQKRKLIRISLVRSKAAEVKAPAAGEGQSGEKKGARTRAALLFLPSEAVLTISRRWNKTF